MGNKKTIAKLSTYLSCSNFRWHPTKNDDQKFSSFGKTSKHLAWWVCDKGHEWKATVTSVLLAATPCPYCAGRKAISGVTDLATINPELASQWHSTLNGKLNPCNFLPKSNIKVWWKCDKGHEWETAIGNRTAGKGCPICSGNKAAVGFNDLATTNPDIMEYWNYNKNLTINPQNVTAGSNIKVNWVNKNCNHSWVRPVKAQVKTTVDCPICDGTIVLKGFNDLKTTHPDVASQWHPTKNGILKPTEVFSGGNQKVWWLGECEHEWEATIVNRNNNIGKSCPYCSGRKVLKGFNDLATVDPVLAAQWHPTLNGNLEPTEVTVKSAQEIWWQCEKGHSTLNKIYVRSNGIGCTICSGRKVLKGFNDLKTTHPDVASQWHSTKNSFMSPETVSFGCDSKAWWVCDEGHEWEARIANRTIIKRGCPICWQKSYRSQGEKDIYTFLENSTAYSILIQDHSIIYPFELDIYVPEKNFGIEFNGVYWHNENHVSSNYHYNKWLGCKEKGVQLIQVWEDDWNRNPELIKRMLAHKLGVSTQPKVFARKTIAIILTTKQAQVFLNKNHIQGFVSGSYYLGLQKKGTQNLTAVLVLKKEANNTLNIVRYATSVNVMGGFTKLLKYAETTYTPERFITFSDNCVSDGGLYENNGFIADKQLKPDYMYVAKGERKHKFGYRLKKFRDDPELLWQEGLTEKELAQLNNLPRIWDAGKTRWVKELKI